MRFTFIPCLLLVGSCLFASEEPAWPPKGTQCGESVLAFYEEGPNFARAMQVYPEHLKYLTELLKQGKVAAAGRMKDATKALMIVRTKDLAEAQACVNQEWANNVPFVQKGVVRSSFLTWGHCWAPGTPAPDFVDASGK
jgi:uncharacterized protein YciI